MRQRVMIILLCVAMLAGCFGLGGCGSRTELPVSGTDTQTVVEPTVSILDTQPTVSVPDTQDEAEPAELAAEAPEATENPEESAAAEPTNDPAVSPSASAARPGASEGRSPSPTSLPVQTPKPSPAASVAPTPVQTAKPTPTASPAPQPTPTAHVHNYQPVYRTVHHDAVTEEQWVVDEPACDSPVYTLGYRCQCGAWFADTGSLQSHRNSFLDTEQWRDHSSWSSSYEQTGTIHYDEIGHWETVVISPAWDEEVLDYYICDCGDKKYP